MATGRFNGNNPLMMLARLQNFPCFETSFDLWKVDDKNIKFYSGAARDEIEETGGKIRSAIWNQWRNSMTRVRKNLDRNKAM